VRKDGDYRTDPVTSEEGRLQASKVLKVLIGSTLIESFIPSESPRSSKLHCITRIYLDR
jgi:hypothetical protein